MFRPSAAQARIHGGRRIGPYAPSGSALWVPLALENAGVGVGHIGIAQPSMSTPVARDLRFVGATVVQPLADVLVVDDDAQLRLLLTDLLEGLGYRVVSASNGAEAIARLGDKRPDAVLLDLQMPEVDGWAVLHTCRAIPQLADVPVVVMSAMPEADRSVADFRVMKCLAKPFDLDDLVTVLETVEPALHRGEQQGCAYCKAEMATQTLRVFTAKHPDGRWPLCHRCWNFLQVGFVAHQPGQDLDIRLAGPVMVHATEARTWITTGLKQIGRRSAATTRMPPQHSR